MRASNLRSAVRSIAAATAVAALASSADVARAADLDRSAESLLSGWSWRTTSYVWLTWLDGDVTVRGREFDVDASPDEVLGALNFGLMGTIEGRRGPWSLWSDLVYASLGSSNEILTSGPNGAAALAVSAKVRMTTFETAVAYELGSSSRQAHLDVFAGARYWAQRVDVALDVAGATTTDGLDLAGTQAFARSGRIDWVDPFIGVRLRYDLASGSEAFVRGDVGGFGAGSELSWQAIAAINWHVCDDFAIAWDSYIGYRALSVDFSQGTGVSRYAYDVIEHGPVIGVTGRF